MNSRDYHFLGTTQSLCPECLSVVPAKIVTRDSRVYFRKQCPEHGPREDYVCGDLAWWDRHVGSAPGKLPQQIAVEPRLGCPYDCGLCTEHEQHTCLALLEITQHCNLTCPMCFASSAPGLPHLSFDECRAAIDSLVAAEGRPEVLQLSGGEPTLHPQVLDIIDYAISQPIDIVMINTNGVRLARDPDFVASLTAYAKRFEVYLQFDGLHDDVYRSLRGAELQDTKLAAIEACGRAGLNVTLVCTVQAGVNLDQVGAIVDFAVQRPWVTGVSFQPATYVGRHVLPEQLAERVTFPDVLHGIQQQTKGRWRTSDFTPLPCAHPNAHSIAYAYRSGGVTTPLARLIDIGEHIDLFSGSITYTRPKARELITEVMNRQCCGAGGCGCGPAEPAAVSALPVVQAPASRDAGDRALASIGMEFTDRALREDLDPRDVFRVTTTSFMDAYTFDLRQLMKSCVQFVLPSGHQVPFSAYNVLYRDGHVPLPKIARPQPVLL